jgi:hypothetical protein
VADIDRGGDLWGGVAGRVPAQHLDSFGSDILLLAEPAPARAQGNMIDSPRK